MIEESSKLNFEKAKELKEMIDYIKYVLDVGKVELKDNIDRDVFAYHTSNGYISIIVFFIRGGKILEKKSSIYPIIDDEENEMMRYIANFYEKNIIKPKEIFVPDIVDENILEEILELKVVKPQKGIKKALLDMALENAKTKLTEKFELIKKDEERTYLANEELGNKLDLPNLRRVEIFDIAHLFGSYNVSGMVVYVDGKPSKNDYRKYKISVDKNDDYGAMKEVIYRRYFKVLMEDLTKPDLIIVDGSIGQINAATSIITSLGLSIPIVGLKKDNKHSTNALIYNNNEIKIDKRSNLFYLLERMQDEVHEFTINYHKQLRSKGSLESILESVDGIGNKRRIELLKKYKTITKMKEASISDLEEILPTNVALELKDFLSHM